jgi:hypothetical protein
MAIAQQTFLGASITNFALNMGWNESASTLTVGLVVDDLNAYLPNGSLRTFNAFDEGYHPWDAGMTAAPDFLGPSANGGSNGTYPRYDHAGNDNLGHKSYYRYDYFLTDNTDPTNPIPTPGNRPVVPNAEALYSRGDFFAPPPVGSPVWFKFYDHIENPADARYRYRVPARSTGTYGTFANGALLAPVFQFNGLLTGFSRKMDVGSGELYDITIEDPRKILEGVQVILDIHKTPTAPPDGDWGNAKTIYGDEKYSRKYRDGYGGYYNIINVFGYYENWESALARPHSGNALDEQQSDFFRRAPSTGTAYDKKPGYGVSDINEAGIRWYDPDKPSILPALQHIMFGNEFGNADTNIPGIQFPYDPSEPFGGPIYYTPKPPAMSNSAIAGSPITGPKDKQSYRYKIDLSELYTLSQTFGGILPNYYRVKATNITLLQLIQDICNIASADFFIELLPDVANANKYPANYPAHNAYSLDGIIKVRVRQRVTQPSLVALQQEIRNAETFTSHRWYGRLTSNNVGVEFGNEVGGKMVVGSPETRVIGVSPLGEDKVRDEYGACYQCKSRITGAVDDSIKSQADCDARTQVGDWEWGFDKDGTASNCKGLWTPLRERTSYDGVQGPIDGDANGDCFYANKGKCTDITSDPPANVSAYKNDSDGCYANQPAGKTYIFEPKKNTGYADAKIDCTSKGGDCFDAGGANVSGYDDDKTTCEAAGHEFTASTWEQKGGYDYTELWRQLSSFEETNKTYADAPDDGDAGRFVWVGLDKNDWINDNWNAETRTFRFNFEKVDCLECGNRAINIGGGLGVSSIGGNEGLKAHSNIGNGWKPDIRLDIFPCWGFENRVILEGNDGERAQLNNASLPIKGEFDSMYPERDFQRTTGLIEAFEWVMGDYNTGCFDPVLDNDNANLTNPNCEGFNATEVLEDGELDGWLAFLDAEFDTAAEGTAIGDPDFYTFTREDCVKGWKVLDYMGPEAIKDICVQRNRRHAKNGEPVKISTADIKIDLREVGYSADGGFHHATISELRTSLIGFDAWKSYVKLYDPRFAQVLGILQLPTGAAGKYTVNKKPAMNAGGGNNQSATQGLTKIPLEVANESKVWQSGEKMHEKNQHVYELIKNIASAFYGKQFLVPLPFDPQLLEEHRKRTSADDKGQVPSFKESTDWEIVNAGWVEPIHKSVEDAEQLDYKYPFDLTFYDNAGLMEPFMVFPLYHETKIPDDTSITSIKILGGGSGYLSPPTVYIGKYTKISAGGVPVVPKPGDSKGGRWARARTVIDEDGTVVKIILENTGTGYTAKPTINFSDSPTGDHATGEVEDLTDRVLVRIDLSEFNRDDYYIEPERTDNDKDDVSQKNLTRVFIKASVDTKTYFLESELLRPGRLKINDKGDEYETNWEDTASGASDAIDKMKSHVKLVPYALIKLSGSVRYGEDDPSYPTSKTYNSPSSTNIVVGSNLQAARGTAMDKAFFEKQEAAKYKPWDAAVPQQATRKSWGPWGAGRTYGRAEFEEDSSLSPENFGSEVLMGLVGRSKAWNDSVGYQSTESGSVSLVGLPEYPVGAALVANGPYITNMAVDVGAGGITTTYTMQTFRPNFGDISRYDRERITRIHNASTSLAKEQRNNIKFIKSRSTKK